MPIYQYTCPKCSSQFEVKQSFSDEPTASCPKCKHEARRLFVPAPIIFKGSGFYVTDHRKNGDTQGPAPSKKEETTSSATASEASGETSKSSSAESKSNGGKPKSTD